MEYLLADAPLALPNNNLLSEQIKNSTKLFSNNIVCYDISVTIFANTVFTMAVGQC